MQRRASDSSASAPLAGSILQRAGGGQKTGECGFRRQRLFPPELTSFSSVSFCNLIRLDVSLRGRVAARKALHAGVVPECELSLANSEAAGCNHFLEQILVRLRTDCAKLCLAFCREGIRMRLLDRYGWICSQVRERSALKR